MAQQTRNRRRTYVDEGAAMTPAPSNLARHNDAPLAPVEEPRFDIFSDVVPWFVIGACIYSGAAVLAIVIAGSWLTYRAMQRKGVRVQDIDPRDWRIVTGTAALIDQISNRGRRHDSAASATPADEPVLPATTQATPAPAAATTQQQGPKVKTAERPQYLSPDQFARDPLFRALDEQPHRFVIGHSQGGKSTALHGMAMAWSNKGEPVIVCDPDAAWGQWPGCKVAGYAEDYRGIYDALQEVQTVFEERSGLYAKGQRDFEPYHLVLDEVHEIFANVPRSREFVLDTLGRRGAKRGIRVTMGTQDNNKDTLGLDDAAVLNNFITAELEMNERGQREATVYRGNAGRKKHVQKFALPPLPGAKSFIQQYVDDPEPEPVATRALAADDLLAGLLAQEAPATKPSLDERIAAALRQAEQQQTVTIARDGGDVHVHVNQQTATVAPATDARITRPHKRERREGAVNVRERQKRLERKAYYEQAAREGRSLQSAYDAREQGDKGDYNLAARWYRAEKARIKPS